MTFNLATIKIKNLRLRTYIGINEDEIKNKQDVVVNVKIDYDAEKATNTDNMSDALNYKTITKAIIKLVEDKIDVKVCIGREISLNFKFFTKFLISSITKFL